MRPIHDAFTIDASDAFPGGNGSQARRGWRRGSAQRGGDGLWETVHEAVAVVWVRCRLGGAWAYFACPIDSDKLERLGRYGVHLDRKLERTLSTLLRLKELRGPAAAE
jgi:hypothetical protein